MKVSIIIPIKSNLNIAYISFIEYITGLSEQLKDNFVQIVIADESPRDAYKYSHQKFKSYKNIYHFVPKKSLRTGANDKLNGVYAALQYAKFDKILLVDDHFRLKHNTLNKIDKYYSKYGCFKFMPKFDDPSFSVLIDLSGMTVINIVDRHKQFCGHLAFRKHHFTKWGFPSRDGLFDELTLEIHLRKNGISCGFVKDIALEAVTAQFPCRGTGGFFLPRVT